MSPPGIPFGLWPFMGLSGRCGDLGCRGNLEIPEQPEQNKTNTHTRGGWNKTNLQDIWVWTMQTFREPQVRTILNFQTLQMVVGLFEQKKHKSIGNSLFSTDKK